MKTNGQTAGCLAEASHSNTKANSSQANAIERSNPVDAISACPTLPRLNEPAPEFSARTTHGPKQLSDYRGRWLILFSHPSDFTPVCTTEFIGFAKAFERFQTLNCDLLGLSIDSVFSHLAWVDSIKKNFGVDIPFPIIDDLSMRVANAYGMVQPGASDTAAVRTTFIIDPEGIMRAMAYYPMSNGRSVEEFLRLLEALQTSDRHRVATPEAWRPGEDVIVPPPATVELARERLSDESCTCRDWYFCTKPLDENQLSEPVVNESATKVGA